MILVKDNFPGRWEGSLCNICKHEDTMEHLYSCPGFSDIIGGGISHDIFFSIDIELDVLHTAAEIMVRVNERLKVVQEL